MAYAGYGLLNLIAVAGLLGALTPAAVVWLGVCVVSVRATRRYVAYRASLDPDDFEVDDPQPVAGCPEQLAGCVVCARVARRQVAARASLELHDLDVYEPARYGGS